jgi:hypothetical protein
VNGLFLTVQMLSDCVEQLYASWRLPPVSRRTCQRYRVVLYGDKKNGGFDFSKPPHRKGILAWEKALPSSGFFLFCRWADKI